MVRPEADAPFSLCAGHPALDLVNTLDNRFLADGPTELLGDYTALLRFAEQSGLLSGAQTRVLARRAGRAEAERVSTAARDLREAAASILYGRLDGSAMLPKNVRTLESYVRSARAQQELMETPTPQLAWDWRLSSATEADLPVWILSLQTSALLTSAAMSRLRSCQTETCRWLFLDTSKNHSRRWCDMKVCGNRMKARRFQARQG
jgi:predicted RNA-binding Zn ribbon-like protein